MANIKMLQWLYDKMIKENIKGENNDNRKNKRMVR